jgi:hypothetical protein
MPEVCGDVSEAINELKGQKGLNFWATRGARGELETKEAG